MITPTWDTLLLFSLIAFVVFGFVVRRAKIGWLLVSLYVALCVSNGIGLELFRFIKKAELAGFDASLFMVKFIIFAFISFMLFIDNHYISPDDEGGSGFAQSFTGALYGLLAGGIIITSVIGFMGSKDHASLLAKSFLARTLDPWHVFFLIPFPFMLAISSLLKRFK